jgi:hypothetical protein
VLPPAAEAPAAAGPLSQDPSVVGGLCPTAEQAAIINTCVTGENLVLETKAGTGKTSTLRMAATKTGGRGFYIAFNRAIAGDAKKSAGPVNHEIMCSVLRGDSPRARR